jgi:hypothetical protein
VRSGQAIVAQGDGLTTPMGRVVEVQAIDRRKLN